MQNEVVQIVPASPSDDGELDITFDANGRLIVAGTALQPPPPPGEGQSVSPLPPGEGQGVRASSLAGDGSSSFAVACYDPGLATLPIQITDVPPVLQLFGNQVATEGQALNLSPLGRFMHAPVTSGAFGYMVDWGDGSTPDSGTAAILAVASAGTQLVGTVPGQHTYAAAGTYCVVATVTDPDLQFATQSLEVVVNPASPVATSITCDTSVPSDLTERTFGVNFSAPVTNVLAADFVLAAEGVTGTIASVTPGTTDGYGCYSTCTLTVDNVSFTDDARRGTLGLDLLDDNSTVDSAGNPLGGPARPI